MSFFVRRAIAKPEYGRNLVSEEGGRASLSHLRDIFRDVGNSARPALKSGIPPTAWSQGANYVSAPVWEKGEKCPYAFPNANRLGPSAMTKDYPSLRRPGASYARLRCLLSGYIRGRPNVMRRDVNRTTRRVENRHLLRRKEPRK